MSTTEQQRAAIAARGVSVVLSSGAGCGKTTVLTARYLKHLADDGAEPSQVAAITFTDRAARDMRDRIRQGVEEKLQKAHGESAERWADYLRQLETAPIGTIHSFCGNLLRQHAVAAGLDPQFEILEEVLASNLRSESMRDCLHELLTSTTPASSDLAELVVDFGWFSARQAVGQLAGKASPSDWDKWLKPSPEQVVQTWLGPAAIELRRRYVEHLCTTDRKILSFLNLLRIARCSDSATRANVRRILEETPTLGGVDDPGRAIDELCDAAKFGTKREKAWFGDADIYNRVKDASAGYREALIKKVKSCLIAPDAGELDSAILTGQRFVRVAFEVWEAYQLRKRRGGCLDFQDLLVMARDLLRNHPDVRDAVRKRVRFLLLDEAQDIDPVQMDLIFSLCDEVGVEAGKLFTVGDQKQSIYRFRGAQVKLFRELRQRIPEAGRMRLSRNFRSQPPILHFVNALCSSRMPDYEPLDADRTEAGSDPKIEFLWSVPDSRGGGKESVGEVRRREADMIARRIAVMTTDRERRVWDAGKKSARPAQLEDVVLLFRSMSNVPIYEEALRRHGLDYYLVGGRAFFAQQEIYDLYHLLRALENPADSLSLAGALRSPFCCLNDETLFLIGSIHRGDLWKGLHEPAVLAELAGGQAEAVMRARDNLRRWRGLKDRLPIVRLIGAIFADCGYDAAMQFEFMADRKLANLWKLQNLARTFDGSGMFGLPEFIERLGELVQEQPREEQAATLPEKANVVKLMSIHQAKGLEFPIVIVPDLAAKISSNQTQSVHFHDDFGCLVRPPENAEKPLSDYGKQLWGMSEAIADWEEALRILYVACTRAEDLLILSAGFDEPLKAGPLKTANPWISTLSERFNPLTGECIAADVEPTKQPTVRVQVVEGMPPEPVPARAEPQAARHQVLSLPSLAPASLPGLLMLPVLELMALNPPNENGKFESLLDASNPVPYEEMVLSIERRLLDKVLTWWDLRDTDGWKSALDQCVEEAGAPAATGARAVLTKWLQTFTASELFSTARQSEDLRGHTEFLLSQADGSLPPCRGWIDICFGDAQGHSAIIAFHTDRTASLAKAAKLRKPFLDLQAEALRRQFGHEVLQIDLLDLESGKSTRVAPGSPAEAWKSIERLLKLDPPKLEKAKK